MITRSPVKPTRPSSSGVPHTRRAPTPMRSTPVATATTSILTSSTATGSTATPHEAMVASQLAHINDLVQKNRSLEQTIKKLNEDLSKSGSDIIAFTAERASWEADCKTWACERQKWMDERGVWTEGCDTMQAYHRIQQYRISCTLHDERVAVLKTQEVARKEQLKRLQRDYKITMFQAREAELEAQLDQVEERRDEVMEARAYLDKYMHQLKARSTALADEVRSKTVEIQAVHKQREQAEDELRRLREAHADATASSTATSSKFARLTTERDALEAQVTSFRRSLELSQDEITQLRTQLANWQELKKGENVDAEEIRRKNVKLEQELGEVRGHISELGPRAAEAEVLEAKLQKREERVEKLKHFLGEWKVEAQGQTTARRTAETRLSDAQAKITTLEHKISELQARLSPISKPKSLGKKIPSPRESTQLDEELEAALSSPSTSTSPIKVKRDKSNKKVSSKPISGRPADAPAKPRPKPLPLKQPDPVLEFQDSDIEILDIPPVPTSAAAEGAKAKGKQRTVHDHGNKSGNETGEGQKRTKKRKTKNTEKDAEARGPERSKVVRPKKTSPSDDAKDLHSKTKAKTNPKKSSSPDPSRKSKAKLSQPREDLEDAAEMETEDAGPKKKKRKINLFGGSQPTTFDWNLLGQAEEGLGIPTRLSPMKQTDVVPRRLGRTSKG